MRYEQIYISWPCRSIATIEQTVGNKRTRNDNNETEFEKLVSQYLSHLTQNQELMQNLLMSNRRQTPEAPT